MSQYYYNPFGSGSGVNEAMHRELQKQQMIKNEKHEIRMISLTMGCAIVAYIIIQAVVSGALLTFDLYDLYLSNALFQYSFSIIGVSFAAVAVPFGVMALINKKKYTSPLIPNKVLKPQKVLAWICFGMLCCCISQVVVSFIVTFFQTFLGLELQSSEVTEPDSVFSSVMCLISLAIIPALCEEFAMRCCSLQLLKKYGKGFSVVAVSIVFGLLHGNVVQFIFAFSVGLILGYITVTTDSIVPAVFIHALNNSMSVVQLILNKYIGEDASSNTITAIYIVWIAAGIISAVYLALKKELIKKSKSRSVLTTGQKFTAFLFPWMIVPFLILIGLTATTVAKV